MHGAFALLRHRPIFPGGCPPSIFGTNGLNYCVRNGNRWVPAVINTAYLPYEKNKEPLCGSLFFGSPCRARTNDPAVNSRMLCQLS